MSQSTTENGLVSSYMQVFYLGLKILRNLPAKKAADNKNMNICKSCRVYELKGLLICFLDDKLKPVWSQLS